MKTSMKIIARLFAFFVFASLSIVDMSAAAPANTKRIISGYCGTESFAAASGIDEDVTKRKKRFDCDGVQITFLDRQRIRFTFLTPPRSGEVSKLEFTGTSEPADSEGQVINVTNFAFDGPPVLSVTDSMCKLFFDGETVKSLFCGAKYVGGLKYYAVIVFNAEPGQPLREPASEPQSPGLKSFIGKTPTQLLASNPGIVQRMQTLLGSKYKVFRSNMDTQSGFEVYHGIMYSSTCRAHMCTEEDAMIMINLADGTLHLALHTRADPDHFLTYSEDPDHFPEDVFNEKR